MKILRVIIKIATKIKKICKAILEAIKGGKKKNDTLQDNNNDKETSN